MTQTDKCTVYAVVSGKGGVGKSTVTCGLGAAFADSGLKTLLIDADEGLRCLDLMLGVASDVVFDMGDVLAGRCPVEDAVKAVPGHEDLFLLPAPANHGEVGDGLCGITDSLRDIYDRIVIDATAGVGSGFHSAVRSADAAIVVVSGDPVTVRDARSVCSLLDEDGVKQRRMIINRYDYKAMKQNFIPHIDSLIDSTALRLIGIVPYDSRLVSAAVDGRLPAKGNAKRAFRRIAERLNGKQVRLPKLKKI